MEEIAPHRMSYSTLFVPSHDTPLRCYSSPVITQLGQHLDRLQLPNGCVGKADGLLPHTRQLDRQSSAGL